MRTLAFFGLLPSLLISAYALPMVWFSTRKVLSGQFLGGGLNLIAACAVIVGTYSLGRYVFGAPLAEFFPGVVVGLGVMIAIVASPIILHILNDVGLYKCPFVSGFDCYGGAIGTSMIGIFSLPAYLAVTIKAIMDRGNNSHTDDDLP